VLAKVCKTETEVCWNAVPLPRPPERGPL